MNEQEKLQTLTDAYNYCLSSGKVRTRKEFAELIGVHHTTLSSAFNNKGNYLTDSLVAKAAAILAGTVPSDKGQDTLLVIPTGARAGTLGDFAESVQMNRRKNIGIFVAERMHTTGKRMYRSKRHGEVPAFSEYLITY